MSYIQADNKPAIKQDIQEEATILMMEPLLAGPDSRFTGELLDLSLELAAKSAALRRALPAALLPALAGLIRITTCHYLNLLDGRDIHPHHIARALANQCSQDREARVLELTARAQVKVQEWIAGGGVSGRAATVEGIREIHRRCMSLLPDSLLERQDPDTGEPILLVPGELRQRDCRRDRHLPVRPWALPNFLRRFEQVYAGLGTSDTILGAPAAHHRLLWIQPFDRGNTLTARLFSQAMLADGLDCGNTWSLARGLARNPELYRRQLAACAEPRRRPDDGRGYLSEEALVAFSRYFLQACLAQVDFMTSLLQRERLHQRLLSWAGEEKTRGGLPPRTERLLTALLHRGTLPRGDVPALLGVGDRQARRVVAALIDRQALTSPTSRAPISLAFPVHLASSWLPGLLPE